MNRLSIFKENDPKEPVFHFRDLDPPTDAAVSLNVLPNWIANRPCDPVVLYHRAIRPRPDKLEVICDLHMLKVSEQDGMSSCGIIWRSPACGGLPVKRCSLDCPKLAPQMPIIVTTPEPGVAIARVDEKPGNDGVIGGAARYSKD